MVSDVKARNGSCVYQIVIKTPLGWSLRIKDLEGDFRQVFEE
jgi:hypothetical protein